MAGGRSRQSRRAARSDGHAQCLVQRRTVGLELRRRRSHSLPRLLREDADKPRDSQLRHLPPPPRPGLDQRQGLLLSGSKGRGARSKRRGRHQPLQPAAPQGLHAAALCTDCQESPRPRAVRRHAAAGRLSAFPQGGRLLPEVPHGSMGHRLPQRIRPLEPRAGEHRTCQRAD